MKRSAIAVVAIAIMIVGMMSQGLQAVDTVEWVGGSSGEWNTGSVWENTTTNVTGDAVTIFGQNNGSDGATSLDPNVTRARNIVIGGGATVEYNAEAVDSDFRIRQGSNLTIKEGAVWLQDTDATYTENRWTQIDASNLILDGGTFRRTGESPFGDGGGFLMFSTYRGEDNFGVLPPPEVINVEIKNGGKLENTGSLLFGIEGEHPPNAEVSFIIDNGSMDLTGGDVGDSNDIIVVFADMAFFYAHDGISPYNEKYEINFRGPGSITVDTAGIKIYRQDPITLVWDDTVPSSTYEELWNEGILKSKGMTGGYYDPVSGLLISTGQAFSNFFTTTGTNGSPDYRVDRKNPTVVTWDGGAGEWNDDAKWNGGQTATTVLGTNVGTNGGHAIVIDGSAPGGANVAYDGNEVTGTNGDFRLQPNNGISSLTIKNGGVLTLNSADDIDGVWTRMGGDLTIDGAGSMFQRTKSAPSISGGVMLLGAFSQKFGQEIDVNITNGGLLDNEGELYWGGDGGENAAGLSVTITIDGGTMNLHGGDEGEIGNGANGLEEAFAIFGFNVEPTMLFTRTPRAAPDENGPAGDANEQYVINFTGGGSITVDSGGIYEAVIDEFNQTVNSVTAKTYQDLWADGVLQANGESGLTGATFGDFFSVTGTHLSDGYTLTSLLGGGLAGDYNGDGTVNAADYTVWRDGGSPDDTQAGYDLWKTNFGNSGAGAGSGSGAVPEPSSVALALTVLLAGLAIRRSRG